MKTPFAVLLLLAWSAPVFAGFGERPPPPPSVSNYLVGVPPHHLAAALLSLSLAAALLGLGLIRGSPAEDGPPPLPWTLPLGSFLLAVGVVVPWLDRHLIGYSYWTFGLGAAQGPALQTSNFGTRRMAPGPPFGWLLVRSWLMYTGCFVVFGTLALLIRRQTLVRSGGVSLWLALCNYPLLVLAAAMAEAGSRPEDFLSLLPLWYALLAGFLACLLNCHLLTRAFFPHASIFDLDRQIDNLIVVLVNVVTVFGLCCL
ncbi:MAG: hypothetical protein JNM56_04980 [Planctomycetia bacterium]|nr:hypothetical protein [Planctomycetia bacterium]